MIDNRMPNLVNLNEDPQLSEMLLYVLKEGMITTLCIYTPVVEVDFLVMYYFQ